MNNKIKNEINLNVKLNTGYKKNYNNKQKKDDRIACRWCRSRGCLEAKVGRVSKIIVWDCKSCGGFFYTDLDGNYKE